MTKLSDSQRTLLSSAIQSDGAISAAPEHKPAIAGLIKRGYFISVPQDEGPSRLMITDAGRAAVADDAGGVGADRQPAPPEPGPEPSPPSAGPPKGKIGTLVSLLSRPEGATLDVMMAETGWQAHSVRGAMSGAIKKGLGLEVISEKTEAGRRYRIAAQASA